MQLSTSAASPTPVHESSDAASNVADALRNELRQLRIELSISTRRVAAATGLNDSDLDVLDVWPVTVRSHRRRWRAAWVSIQPP